MKTEAYYVDKLKDEIYEIKNIIRMYERYLITIKRTECDYMRRHCMKSLHRTYFKINQYDMALQKLQGSRYVNWRLTELNILEKYTLSDKDE